MPHTVAHKAFQANMHRASAFLAIFDSPGGYQRGQGQPSNDEKELLRATVVFSVAALDNYCHDVVLERVLDQGVNSPDLQDALRGIAKEDPALALRVAMSPTAEERAEQFRAALSGWLSTKSFQGPAAVIRALGYVGLAVNAAHLGQTIGTTWSEELTRWTDMRHQLVHRAAKPYIKRVDAGQCYDLISEVEAAAEQLVTGL